MQRGCAALHLDLVQTASEVQTKKVLAYRDSAPSQPSLLGVGPTNHLRYVFRRIPPLRHQEATQRC